MREDIFLSNNPGKKWILRQITLDGILKRIKNFVFSRVFEKVLYYPNGRFSICINIIPGTAVTEKYGAFTDRENDMEHKLRF